MIRNKPLHAVKSELANELYDLVPAALRPFLRTETFEDDIG